MMLHKLHSISCNGLSQRDRYRTLELESLRMIYVGELRAIWPNLGSPGGLLGSLGSPGGFMA